MRRKATLAVTIRIGVILILFLTACLSGAAVCAAPPPDTGAVLDSVKQPENAPPAEAVPPDITIPEPGTNSPSGNQQTIRVEGFRFGGESPVPEIQLLKLIAAQANQDLTLDDLNRLADMITAYLRNQGYPVAFTYLPAQRIQNGIVTIAVVPGRFGEIQINNRARIFTLQLQKVLDNLKPGAIITKKDLERTLLLLNDLSGVNAQARLKAGATAGTSDLVVEVTDASFAAGNLSGDTWGSRYTGSERTGVQLTLHNLDLIGDELSLGGVISRYGRLNNASLAYSAPLSGSGLRLNLNCNTVSYTLGEDFALLDANGQAQVYGLELSYPFIRSRRFNLSGQVGYENKELRDVVGYTDTVTPRASQLWHLGLAGNSTDTWRGGGNNQFSLTIDTGYLSINDNDASDTDATSAKSAGGFAKLLLSYNRNQHLAPGLNLDIRFNGQLAAKNLDSSEKFYLGGADGVRAYPQGEGAGDEGLRLTAEVQWRVPGVRGDGAEKLYLSGFCDYGYITVNKYPWDLTARNGRGLSAIGLGLLYTWSSDFYARCDYAWKLGNETATSATDRSGRCWIKIVKSF